MEDTERLPYDEMENTERLAYGLVDFVNFLETDKEFNDLKSKHKLEMEYTGHCEWSGDFDTQESDEDYDLKRLFGFLNTRLMILSSEKEIQTENLALYVQNTIKKGRNIDSVSMGMTIKITPYLFGVQNLWLPSTREQLIDMLINRAKSTWWKKTSILSVETDLDNTDTLTIKLQSHYVLK